MHVCIINENTWSKLFPDVLYRMRSLLDFCLYKHFYAWISCFFKYGGSNNKSYLTLLEQKSAPDAEAFVQDIKNRNNQMRNQEILILKLDFFWRLKKKTYFNAQLKNNTHGIVYTCRFTKFNTHQKFVYNQVEKIAKNLIHAKFNAFKETA